MTAFSKRVEYGLMALFHLDESSDDELTSRRQISDAYQIPLELAGKVLQDLKHAGLVTSVQGARGGYRLTKPLETVTLGDVITSLDGPIRSVKCGSTKDSGCKKSNTCNIRHFARRVGLQLNSFYFTIPLKDLPENVKPQKGR